jgi:putative NIF3 family GTP cyclohydrolase 1 type 2
VRTWRASREAGSPRREHARLLRRELREFEVSTVVQAGWSGKRNGELLRLAATRFDVFVTGDRNIPHQQVVTNLSLGVIVVAAGGLKVVQILPHVEALRAAIEHVQAGQILFVPDRA